MPRYAAFVSYAHRYREWVHAFHRDLEACLRKHESDSFRPVFLDDEGLRIGLPWGAQLEKALAETARFILVVTPETLASPWSRVEREVFRSENPRWQQGRFLPLLLVDTPLPPYVKATQYLDLREHDEESYRDALRKVVAWCLDSKSSRHLPELAEELAPPACPAPELPQPLRAGLVEALEPLFRNNIYRGHAAQALGLEAPDLAGFEIADLAASAALVLARGKDTAPDTAIRVIDQLTRAFGDDEAAAVELLQERKREIREHLATALTAKPSLGKEPAKPLLDVYREQVAGQHERLVDYFHRGQELELLDRVFVDLELRQRTRHLGRHADHDAVKSLELGRDHRLRELLALSPEEHSWVTRRWVVLGDPGSGKTTLLRHLAWTLASASPEAATSEPQGQPLLPVFASLPRLLRRRHDPLSAAEETLRMSGAPAEGLARVLDNEAQAGRVVFLLDGLDEVPADERDAAESQLRRLDRRFPSAPVLVASRPVGYRKPLAEAVEVELQPLDRARRLEFLARWFGRHTGERDVARAEAKLPLLENDPGLWELSGNPLYLTLMALILEDDQLPKRNRTQLYDQIFDLLLEGRYRRADGEPPRPLEPKEPVRTALCYLAYGMTQDNRDSEPVDTTAERLYRDEAKEVQRGLMQVERWRTSMRVFLDEVADRSGIYAQHDGAGTDWRFWHRTFREALAAERLEQRVDQEGAETVLAEAADLGGDVSAWAEPYALLTARVKDPDTLLRELMAANSTLGVRALATAERIGDDTLRELLALTGDWEERAEVYKKLPELVGDGERALRLVDRLRQQSRDGNDLFFLHLATEVIGRLWPDHSGSAADLRERFFDHLEAPPANLFREIETPHDGRVPLWREIPAGKHWIGSPEGVGYDFERPRHRFRLEAPLRIGAVPVTNAQYRAFDPEPRRAGKDDEQALHPVVDVTWFEAVSFCRWLGSRVAGCAGASLPSEEEWEAACRAGSDTAYWSGDEESDLERVGWYDGNSGSTLHRVAEKPANPWGLYDVHGNAWEWTGSRWRNSYAEPEPEDSDPTSGWRVVRGGSFLDVAGVARSAARLGFEPGFRDDDLGFRVVLPAP